jgi:signal transduction histidine kinase
VHDLPTPLDSEETAIGNRALNLFPESATKVLKRMLLVGIGVLVSVGLYGMLYVDIAELVPAFIVGIIILSISYRELKMARIDRGLSVLCWSLWTYACVYGYIVGGLRTPILIIVPSLIMTTAWIQGKRPMMWMLSMSAVIFSSYAIGEKFLWLPAPHARKPFEILTVELSVIAISGVIAFVLAENFNLLFEKGLRLTTELRRRVRELRISEDALKELNDQLEQRVLQRTFQYDETNKKLQNLVSSLEQAQAELVNSEKLASLGSMVAGISHELNTPVGNTLTLTTSLENLFQQMQDDLRSGQIRRSEMVALIQTGLEMSVLATKSTKRALDLMSSFKQVAVDQTSEQRRKFNLHGVIEDNLATLLPSIRKQHKAIRIENSAGTDIHCDSFPGPLGQIIVNLTQNAILHGFDNREAGTVRIHTEDHGEVTLLTVSDDGIGMQPNILAHVFDPFFTTKLGQGGSGIGLSISYRIATSILGGNLTVHSTPGEGTRFTLVLPKIAPFKF